MRSRLLVAAVGVPALLYVVLWGPPLLMLAALALLAGCITAQAVNGTPFWRSPLCSSPA